MSEKVQPRSTGKTTTPREQESKSTSIQESGKLDEIDVTKDAEDDDALRRTFVDAVSRYMNPNVSQLTVFRASVPNLKWEAGVPQIPSRFEDLANRSAP